MNIYELILEVKLPYDPVGCPVVGSVCYNSHNGRDVSLPCSYRSTCYVYLHIILMILVYMRFIEIASLRPPPVRLSVCPFVSSIFVCQSIIVRLSVISPSVMLFLFLVSNT